MRTYTLKISRRLGLPVMLAAAAAMAAPALAQAPAGRPAQRPAAKPAARPATKSNQAGSAARPQPVNLPAPKTYQGDPLSVHEYTLANGLMVFISVNKDAPRVYTMIPVRAGSKHDPPTATGLAHYLEHMLFKGTDKLGTLDWAREKPLLDSIEQLYEQYRGTRDQDERTRLYARIDAMSGRAAKMAIANEYDKAVAALGAKGTNAFTSNEQTVYINDIPSNQIERWAALEAERFSKLAPRLFHTELEAVYEEKNISLDRDGSKVFETLYAMLFEKHQYGTQTTIGTIEHLKNPSITEIQRYFDRYYVPGNMAVILAGDVDPDAAARAVARGFGTQVARNVPTYTPPQEAPITTPRRRDVVGPEAPRVMMGYRLPGRNAAEGPTLKVVEKLLFNGTAGLLDINITQRQLALEPFVYLDDNQDYSTLLLGAGPKEGQTLEQVEAVLLAQIDSLRQGKFSDRLLEATITNLKADRMRARETNQGRCFEILGPYVTGQPYGEYLTWLERQDKTTRDQVMDVARRFLAPQSYAIVYKRMGTDPNTQKVVKPAITPVETNRDKSSAFLTTFLKGKAPAITPHFIDYDRDLERAPMARTGGELVCARNPDNDLIDVWYRWDIGTRHEPRLALLPEYIKLLGTRRLPSEALQRELFRLGATVEFDVDEQSFEVHLSGLGENILPSIRLMEEILAQTKPDQAVWAERAADILKERADAKLDKNTILRGALFNYARYGPRNPFNTIVPNAALTRQSADSLVGLLTGLRRYPHHVHYYGKQSLPEVAKMLETVHYVPATLEPLPKPRHTFTVQQVDKPTVLHANYDMVQAELIFLAPAGAYDQKLEPALSLYNEYFGGGMNSLVFQDLRESKALAYSASSRHATSMTKEDGFYSLSYIGTQSDKLPESIKGMMELLDQMPAVPGNAENARMSLMSRLETDRIVRRATLARYERDRRLGNTRNSSRDIYEFAKTANVSRIVSFADQYVKGKPRMLLVLGSLDKMDRRALESYGPMRTLTLEELFGY